MKQLEVQLEAAETSKKKAKIAVKKKVPLVMLHVTLVYTNAVNIILYLPLVLLCPTLIYTNVLHL